jgi:hypothetical protein
MSVNIFKDSCTNLNLRHGISLHHVCNEKENADAEAGEKFISLHSLFQVRSYSHSNYTVPVRLLYTAIVFLQKYQNKKLRRY